MSGSSRGGRMRCRSGATPSSCATARSRSKRWPCPPIEVPVPDRPRCSWRGPRWSPTLARRVGVHRFMLMVTFAGFRRGRWGTRGAAALVGRSGGRRAVGGAIVAHSPGDASATPRPARGRPPSPGVPTEPDRHLVDAACECSCRPFELDTWCSSLARRVFQASVGLVAEADQAIAGIAELFRPTLGLSLSRRAG
jgi:hypothetical protein